MLLKKGEHRKLELLEIKSDVLDVVKRLKRLGSGYRLYFNKKSKKYVLYQIKNNLTPKVYCLTFPYNRIDERMIEYTLKSEVQNRKAYLEELEKSNALLLKREQKNILEKLENENASKRNS